jgi:subtilisin family serine protease
MKMYSTAALLLALCAVGTPALEAQPRPLPPPQAQAERQQQLIEQPAFVPITKPKAFFRQIQNVPFVPGELYVKFRDGVTPAQMQAVSARAGMNKVLHTFRLLPNTFRVSVPVGRERDAINAYLDSPDVVYAEPDYLAETTLVPNDTSWSDGGMYGMRSIRMPDVWDFFTGDPNFRIGVVDSGLDFTHGDISANVWTNPGEVAGNGIDDDGNGYIDDVRGWSSINNNGDITDPGSHGTHVSGTIGAVGNNSTGVVGVNWRCKIVMVRTSNNGRNVSRTVEALEYLLVTGVKVSNHSYGGGGFSQTEYNMFAEAQNRGHLAICAAGNGGADQIGDNNDTAPQYPASFDLNNIIAVAAHTSGNGLTGFSNFGAASVDLAAPGSNILSTVPGNYGGASGTSMASPHVAGVAGIIWAKFPYISWQHLRSRLLTGVIVEGSYDGKLATEGRLDAARSMAVFVRYGGGGSAGTMASPYANIQTALPLVPTGGHMMIRTTTTNWTGTLNKAMYLDAYDGTVVIGKL